MCNNRAEWFSIGSGVTSVFKYKCTAFLWGVLCSSNLHLFYSRKREKLPTMSSISEGRAASTASGCAQLHSTKPGWALLPPHLHSPQPPCPHSLSNGLGQERHLQSCLLLSPYGSPACREPRGCEEGPQEEAWAHSARERREGQDWAGQRWQSPEHQNLLGVCAGCSWNDSQWQVDLSSANTCPQWKMDNQQTAVSAAKTRWLLLTKILQYLRAVYICEHWKQLIATFTYTDLITQKEILKTASFKQT